jgi:hypothetical protein
VVFDFDFDFDERENAHDWLEVWLLDLERGCWGSCWGWVGWRGTVKLV